MAAPNIVNVSSIVGFNERALLDLPVPTVVANNAAASNTVKKINTLLIANVNDTVNAEVSLAIHSEDDGGGTRLALVKNLVVPVGATISVLSAPLYLAEDQSIVATPTTGNDLVVTASGEEIS